MKPDKDYLERLIADTQKKFDEFVCPEVDLLSVDISYMPTRKNPWMGLRSGLKGIAQMKKCKVKETDKIRSNCRWYHQIYKAGQRIVRIDYIIEGRVSISYIAHYESGYRYLFPFDGERKSPYYIIVTHFEDEQVVEEYMVNKDQIIYEQYGTPQRNGRVSYYQINYVPTGLHPILGESNGYYIVDSLEYVEEETYAWYREFQDQFQPAHYHQKD